MKNVIGHLKKKRVVVNKTNVARRLGVCPDFKERREIQVLFKKRQKEYLNLFS